MSNASCEDVHAFDSISARCAFVLNTSDCIFDDGFIQYIEKVYCANSETDSILILVAMFFWCLLMLLLLAVVADEFFGPALVVIAKLLRLSENLAGVTLLALGNGAADIFSAIAAAKTTKEGDAGLIYGSLLGAGILVTTVTTACVALAKPFRTQRRPILKDIIFYIIAVIWNLSIMLKGFIHFGEALGFILLYVLYVSITVASRYVRNRMLRKEEAAEAEAEKQPDTPKLSRKARVSRVASPCQPQLQLTRFKKRSDDDDLGAVNLAYSADLQLPAGAAGTNGVASAVPRRLSPRPSPRASPVVSRAASAASSMRYDDTMEHRGLQRVEGVAVRRSRPVNRESSQSRSMSQYHGLTKKMSMRNQMRSQQLGVPVPQHSGPRPSYLTQWVMAYRQEDDNAMIPSPDPRDMKRQRSRSHLEIQRDVSRMNINNVRARAVSFDCMPTTISSDAHRDRTTSHRRTAANGSFVEISLEDRGSNMKRKSGGEAPVRRKSTILSPEPDLPEVNAEVEDEEEEEEYQVPGFWRHFLETINPLDVLVWRSLTVPWKLLELLRCPMRFLLTLVVPLVDNDHPTKGWCKLLAMLQCFITPIFWMLATQEFTTLIGGVMPVWGLILIGGALFSSIIFFTSKHDEPPKYHFLFALFGFATSIIWIYSVTNEVVNILPTYGVVFKISRAVLALTFLAWANSVGDIMSNTILAKNNFPRIAISACFGGPLFNLLLGLGIPFTMLTAGGSFRYDIKITMVQVILVVFLLITLFSHLVMLFLFRFNVKRYYGVYFIIVYIVFVTVAILSELKVIPSFLADE